ncbi:MAG: hypothetical protein M3128_10200 [Verrucomicrobiota bacterium]|nr:hypothetical protein [Verrucomicrobiota bacterium]
MGNLARNNVGSKGSVIYNLRGNGLDGNPTDVINLAPGFSANKGGNWSQVTTGIINNFIIDGVQGEDAGLYANPTATISVSVPANDFSVHYLTIFSPTTRDNAAHNNAVTITPAGSSTPAATYTVNEPVTGLQNHIYQFEFIGNVTLTFQKFTTSPGDAELQAVFLD